MSLFKAVKKELGDLPIIAEDLGVFGDDVVKLLKDSGFPGMRIVQFGFDPSDDATHLPHNYPINCVAYTGTHDNNTLLGYVWELGEDQRRKMLEYFGYEGEDWNQSYGSILRSMFASHAGLLVLPVQDLLLYGEDTRINRPGNSQGNWSYRIAREQLWEIRRDTFRGWNRLYGRL
jgi:4-alpha-glucanotransferase